MTVKRKIFALVFIIVLSVTVLFAIKYPWNSLGWERKFTVKYIDYDPNGYNNGIFDPAEANEGNPYYIYEITNNTNTKYKNVKLVISCEDRLNKQKHVFKENIFTLEPGETQRINLYLNELKKDAEGDKDIEYLDYSIKYIVADK